MVEYRLSGSGLCVRPPMAQSGVFVKRDASNRSQSLAGVQSSSVNTKNSPLACEAPVLRAVAGPLFDCVTSVISSLSSKEATTVFSGVLLPSSTTITSKQSRG